ncbi:MAG: hypothetical protein AAF497_16395 [Planctomycetota bacterium]
MKLLRIAAICFSIFLAAGYVCLSAASNRNGESRDNQVMPSSKFRALDSSLIAPSTKRARIEIPAEELAPVFIPGGTSEHQIELPEQIEVDEIEMSSSKSAILPHTIKELPKMDWWNKQNDDPFKD